MNQNSFQFTGGAAHADVLAIDNKWELELCMTRLAQTNRNQSISNELNRSINCLNGHELHTPGKLKKHRALSRTENAEVKGIFRVRSTQIMVHQRNRRIHSGQGFVGSFDAP